MNLYRFSHHNMKMCKDHKNNLCTTNANGNAYRSEILRCKDSRIESLQKYFRASEANFANLCMTKFFKIKKI
jgi:hypothetical protein